MLKYIIYGLIILAFWSCASYSKKEFRKDYIKLTEKSLHLINGKYKLYPSKRFGKEFKNKQLDSIRYANLYQEIIDDDWNTKKRFDSLRDEKKSYAVDLAINRTNELQIRVFEGLKIIKDTSLYGKLKNGMFYLENKDLKIDGIPFLFGGYRSDKRRIGITKNKNIIVNTAVGNEGAILLILGAGFRYNSSFEYERIK